MNRIEQAAMRRVPDTSADCAIQPLQGTNDVSAPILTPVIFVVAAGLAAGAAVGYIDAARPGIAPTNETVAAFREPSSAASIGDLLANRRDSVLD